ncbi:MAG: glycosyltransferase family A protein [Candidatus Omnitrophica bacterium]|nr:glycosyltransferase family A protein [Candidatus Omnitrophota bacterium]
MKISIIMLAKNGREHIKRCLDKVTSQKGGHDLEIIAIDSGSNDGTADILKEYPLKLYTIQAEDFSHSRTRNIGASLATGEYIVYLSQDAEPVDEDWLNCLIAPFFKDASVGAVFGKHVPTGKSNPVNRFHIQWIYGNDELIKCKNSEFEFPRKYFSFSNVNAAVRKDLLMRFPFREDLLFCEDVYLAKVLLSNGYKVVYNAAAAVYHSHDYSMAEIFNRYFDIAVAYDKIGILNKTRDIEGEGKGYLLKELKYLAENGYWTWVPYALANNLIKYLGFKMGCAERILPFGLKKRISKYWYKNAEE